MNNNKTRIITRVLWCLLAVVLVIIICYLVYSCRLLNSADDISRDYFSDKKYLSLDSSYYVHFNADVSAFELNIPEADYNNIAITDYYENMIFFDLGDENYIIAVIDDSTLFLSNARVYLYLLK